MLTPMGFENIFLVLYHSSVTHSTFVLKCQLLCVLLFHQDKIIDKIKTANDRNDLFCQETSSASKST